MKKVQKTTGLFCCPLCIASLATIKHCYLYFILNLFSYINISKSLYLPKMKQIPGCLGCHLLLKFGFSGYYQKILVTDCINRDVLKTWICRFLMAPSDLISWNNQWFFFKTQKVQKIENRLEIDNWKRVQLTSGQLCGLISIMKGWTQKQLVYQLFQRERAVNKEGLEDNKGVETQYVVKLWTLFQLGPVEERNK